jgi:hypothetical protein
VAQLSTQAPLTRTKQAPGRSGRGSRQRKGEAQQATAAGLDLLRVLGWLVLHDVTVPGDPDLAIDHVLAGPSGVYVVDTVNWSGAIHAQEHLLTVGGVDRGDALAEVTAAADAVRGLLDGIPVVPLLCFERLEAVAGFVSDVALCASENILDLLTGQPEILDPRAISRASKALTSGFAGDAASDQAQAPAAVASIVSPPVAPVHAQPTTPTDEAGRVAAFARSTEVVDPAPSDAPAAPPAAPSAAVAEVVEKPKARRRGLLRSRGSRRTPAVPEPALTGTGPTEVAPPA